MVPLGIVILLKIFLTTCGQEHGWSVNPPASQSGCQDCWEGFTGCSEPCDVAESAPCSNQGEGTCPPGMFCKGGQCICGCHPPYVITCSGSNFSSVLNCFCVTLDEATNSTLLGACIYNCGSITRQHKDIIYTPLPKRVEQLSRLCSAMNRGGALCGRCLPNYYPTAYSYNWTCIPCRHIGGQNWAKYFAAAYLPLTVFCAVILLLKVNLFSTEFHAITSFSQALALPVVCRVILTDSFVENNSPLFVLAVRLLLSCYGIWNLDFFRPFYSSFCLRIDVLPTLALDYAIAVYPLILMVICYFLIVLYDRNYKVVTRLWRPFQTLFSKMRKNWNIKTSVIDAFVTFFLLSNIKFLSVSFDSLVPTEIYNLHLDYYNTSLGLYYAPDVKYFGKDHLPYAILAIFVLLLFVFFPVTILALYPFNFFQKFLNYFSFRWYILHTFMDAFQGCYKDGTEPGTRDCRWFSAVYFLCRFLLFAVYAATRNVILFTVAAIMFMFLTLLIVAVQPFKLSRYNFTHAIFTQVMALLCTTIASLNMSAFYTRKVDVFILFSCVLMLTPLIYLMLLVLCWSMKRRWSFVRLVWRLKSWRKGYHELTGQSKQEAFSDRIMNPGLYHRENLAYLAVPLIKEERKSMSPASDFI